jgi:catechol 2,3-dioxygenase-like lactoylglutathione lyase family enzyme
MTIVGIDHVQLAMPEGREEDARRFYEDVLGIPEVEKPSHLALRGGVWFEAENVKVHLGVEKDFKPAHKAHPGLVVADFDELVTRLHELGLPVVNDEGLDGRRHAYVRDPFGNRIELLEELR